MANISFLLFYPLLSHQLPYNIYYVLYVIRKNIFNILTELYVNIGNACICILWGCLHGIIGGSLVILTSLFYDIILKGGMKDGIEGEMEGYYVKMRISLMEMKLGMAVIVLGLFDDSYAFFCNQCIIKTYKNMRVYSKN